MAQSVNRVRQMYIANAFNDTLDPAAISPADAGTITGVGYIPSLPNDPYGECIWFNYINVDGQLTKSDYIPVYGLRFAKITNFRAKTPRVDVVSIDAANVVVGQTYTLKVLFREWGSGSAEDQYFKYVGSFKVTSNTQTAEDIFNALADLATRNFEREANPLLNFTVQGTGAAAQLVITEQPQPWTLGKKEGRPLNYDIFGLTITNGAGIQDSLWANIETVQAGYKGNGTAQETANLEYFFMGYRADYYRQNGWPFNWDTVYLSGQNTYDYLDIHYFYRDDHIHSQASDKQLLIACAPGIAAQIQAAIVAAVPTFPLTAPTATADVALSYGSAGTAGAQEITGLTSGETYIVYANYGSNNQVRYNVAADGTLTTGVGAPLTGTSITGLTNGVLYFVEQTS